MGPLKSHVVGFVRRRRGRTSGPVSASHSRASPFIGGPLPPPRSPERTAYPSRGTSSSRWRDARACPCVGRACRVAVGDEGAHPIRASLPSAEVSLALEPHVFVRCREDVPGDKP